MEDDATRRVDEKIEEAQRSYERRGRTLRLLWVGLAVVLVVAGLVMTVVPGPATVVLPAGLVMFAAASERARRLLRRSVARGVAVRRWWQQASKPVKALAVAALACLAVIAVAVVVVGRG